MGAFQTFYAINSIDFLLFLYYIMARSIKSRRKVNYPKRKNTKKKNKKEVKEESNIQVVFFL